MKSICPDEIKYSIVVPVYNQWEYIAELICCLQAQSLDLRRFELLLIDNESDRVITPDFQNLNGRVLCCSQPGSYSARNFGVSYTKGEWLVFTDADCLPVEDWLLNLDLAVSSCSNSKNLIFAGDVRMEVSSPKPSVFEVYDVVKGIRQARYVKQGYAATANMACRRLLMAELKGFDTRAYSGGDKDLSRRAISAGAELVYLQDMVVKHRVRTSAREVFTKTRRLKGGQLQRSSRSTFFFSVMRTFLPPVFAAVELYKSKKHSFTDRMKALLVLVLVWGVEVMAVSQFLLGRKPERR